MNRTRIVRLALVATALVLVFRANHGGHIVSPSELLAVASFVLSESRPAPTAYRRQPVTRRRQIMH